MWVPVIDRCEYCNVKAYVYAGEYTDGDLERPVYQACPSSKSAGAREKAISLREFADLLDRAIAMEPDYFDNVIISLTNE